MGAGTVLPTVRPGVLQLLWTNPIHTHTERGRSQRGPAAAQSSLSLGAAMEGCPSVGRCSDEKPFHPPVFHSPLLAALITGPGLHSEFPELMQTLEKKPRRSFSRNGFKHTLTYTHMHARARALARRIICNTHSRVGVSSEPVS